jgi:hypothetical protein
VIALLIAAVVTTATELPMGSAPAPVAVPHFPDAVHAFVWRNWSLVPVDRMAKVIGAEAADVLRMGKAMGLSDPPEITADQQRRSYITVLRRNWHLLPYDQLLQLLEWTPEEMAYTLREDDFLYVKLGNLKPKCEPLKYSAPDDATLKREEAISRIVHETFPRGVGQTEQPLFQFVQDLSRAPSETPAAAPSAFSPRFCYSYFALYGDPLLETETGPYPDGLLARLAGAGVNGVWLQGVLYKLAPFPWQPELSARYEERLKSLANLVARAKKYGIGIYLYLNEPRAMPVGFFEQHPDMRGVGEGEYVAMCTSNPEVQAYIRDSIASICKAVPDLAGFFSISASENLTTCWSHYQGANCPRCSKRSPAEVTAELLTLYQEGIRKAGTDTKLIAWDWGWKDDWIEPLLAALPKEVMHMSVSEWDIPIERGGVKTNVGEYSISTVGPGPRAQRNWEIARKNGLKTVAKIQAGCTWELSSVPYIPAVENVARHAANLRSANVNGLMLGWTLGGYPSPNLEVVAEMGRGDTPPTPDEAMSKVALRRYGFPLALPVVRAWKDMSAAFSEYPYHGAVVYNAPQQVGPANLLWEKPTGYAATMVGFPYDDLNGWRAVYPADVFAGQFEKVANGFDKALEPLVQEAKNADSDLTPEIRKAIADEIGVGEAAAIQFHSVVNQCRFVLNREALANAKTAEEARPALEALDKILRDEITLAARQYDLQSRDSRIGFEATNQYFFVPLDLAEKVINCRDLLDRWLPAERARFGG